MKQATITFEITEKTTVVNAIHMNGTADKFDITGTDIERDFVKLLKKLQKHQTITEVTKVLDINTWETISDNR